mmetsp:Transcript_83774/g.153251  ORF Transcript_83774/g.153251 Transcript_83774/m.153251 type:complete len:92 (+) Transcript_83774:159-434(+)
MAVKLCIRLRRCSSFQIPCKGSQPGGEHIISQPPLSLLRPAQNPKTVHLSVKDAPIATMHLRSVPHGPPKEILPDDAEWTVRQAGKFEDCV